MDFILATNNMKKLAEMQRILSPLGINVVTAKMLGKQLEDVEEDGKTFEDNAKLKARAACKEMNMPAIADDSGLCVDYLDGAPLEKRTAHYVCAICCTFPDGREIVVRGECNGVIGFERDGHEGFGYDPLFLVDGKAFGRYTAEEKDKISHRGNALRLLTKELEKII